MEPTLVFAVFHLDRPLMEVVVRDDQAQCQRKIDLEWANRAGTNRPPDNWFSTVVGEVDYQRSNRQGSVLSKFLGPGLR